MGGPAQRGARGRWLIAGGVALVTLAGVGLLFRSPMSPPASARVVLGNFVVQLAPPGAADARLREETELRDLRPLFLPTARNADVRESRRDPGRPLLDDEEPKLKSFAAELQVESPVVVLNGRPVGQAEPVDALAPDADLAGLAGFGRRPTTPQIFAARGGFVEIFATRDGALVLAEALPAAARPATDRAWEPVEFLARVDAIGLASPLVLTGGSRVEEVDAHYRKYLAQEFRIGARLPPGFYRITVAP